MKLRAKNSVENSVRALVASLVIGVALPATVLASSIQEALKEQRFPEAMKKVTADAPVGLSDKIVLQAPTLAENGEEVKIQVSANLNNVEQISIFADGNPTPLLANFKVSSGNNMNIIGTRVKLSKTQNIIAVVKADGKYYKAQQVVKVTKGGC